MAGSQSGMADVPISTGRSGRTMALVAGDVAAFLAFAAIGRSSHDEAAGLDALLEVALTAAPFIVGWFAVAPWLGAYRHFAAGSRQSAVGFMLRHTALAWLVAWPVGLLLRSLFLSRGIPVSFAIVTLITNALLLCGWRAVFAWVAARRWM